MVDANMRILLLDTSFAAEPIYSHLKACGHDVWVVGNRDGDLLAKIAKENWVKHDYSDVPYISEIVANLGIQAVVPGCTDVSFDTCLQLTVMLERVDTHQTHLILSDKARFRELCQFLEVKSPSTVTADSFPRVGKFICKPVDSYSGRGCRVFDGKSAGELQYAIQFARSESPTDRFLIETFADGPLHSCSAFVRNRQLENPVYVIEGSSANPYAVDTSYVINEMPASVRRNLESDLQKIISELELKDGLLHTQFILSADGPYILEVSRRCPGDLYPLLIEYSTGLSYVEEYCRSFLGQTSDLSRRSIFRRVLRHTVSADETCIFSGLFLRIPIDLISYFPLVSIGAELRPYQATRAGILFCEVQNEPELANLYDRFLSREVYSLSI